MDVALKESGQRYSGYAAPRHEGAGFDLASVGRGTGARVVSTCAASGTLWPSSMSSRMFHCGRGSLAKTWSCSAMEVAMSECCTSTAAIAAHHLSSA